MRTFVTPVVLLWSALFFAVAALQSVSAEVVHLKNGDVIYADQVKETTGKVEYAIGDDTYTIPKSRVDRIERGARSPVHPPAELPVYTPSAPVENEAQLLDEVVQQGTVNRQALEKIESRGDFTQAAVAYYVAAKQEFQTGKYADARRDFEQALHYDPQNPAIVNFYAALLVRTGNGADAVEYAEKAVRLAPDSADALVVLGFAEYSAGHPRDALQAWKQSLTLRPDTSVQKLIDKVNRELAAESNYSERETGHFNLRYEGAQSSEAFRSQIIATLESEYSELARSFGAEPRSCISVILYTDKAFFDVTQAPSWAGALNDGKLRIPLRGLDSVTSDLARVLKHELAHSFVNQLSMGRCPRWLNEGIAQAMEPRSLASHGARLAEMFKQDREIPFNMLEGSFSSFSGNEAALAYDESLAAVQYIASTYGMSDVIRILDKLGHGESTESALRSTVHSDYGQLQNETGEFLRRQFGN